MKQCLLLFTFLCVAILPSFSQQKIDILGNAGKERHSCKYPWLIFVV